MFKTFQLLLFVSFSTAAGETFSFSARLLSENAAPFFHSGLVAATHATTPEAAGVFESEGTTKPATRHFATVAARVASASATAPEDASVAATNDPPARKEVATAFSTAGACHASGSSARLTSLSTDWGAASAPANVPSGASAQCVSTIAASGSRPYAETQEDTVDAGSARAEVTMRCFTAAGIVRLCAVRGTTGENSSRLARGRRKERAEKNSARRVRVRARRGVYATPRPRALLSQISPWVFSGKERPARACAPTRGDPRRASLFAAIRRLKNSQRP